MSEITILCMYHKKNLVNTNFYPFFEIQCGENESHIRLDMQGDGQNNPISSKNRYWSEITGLYWAWKNIKKTDYIGLCSYRRFFNFEKSIYPVKLSNRLDANEYIKNINYDCINNIFKESDIVLPFEYTYSKSVQKVCEINYNSSDFELLESYISENKPEFFEAYKKIMYGKNKMVGHNMFIMRWEDFNNYCEWVFDILMPLSKLIDASNYPSNQIRVFGYMHELLLSVYVENKQMKITRSQILYVNDSIRRIRFNSVLYRALCNVVYYVKKCFYVS